MSDLILTNLNIQSGEDNNALLQRIAYGARSREAVTIFSSAARTVSTVSGVLDMRGCIGAIWCLNITAASGTGGLRIQWGMVDPIDKVTNEWSYLLGTAKATTGLMHAQFYPGVQVDNVHTISPSIPKVVTGFAKVAVIHGDATSYTYSLSMIPLT